MEVGLLATVFLLVMVALGIPIAFALLTSAFLGMWLLGGIDVALGAFTQSTRQIIASYSWSVFAMFILMGELANELGLVSKAYDAARRWLVFSRGGILSAVFLAAAAFGAISGSSVASAGFFGKVTAPELRKYHYDMRFGLGAIAGAGSLAMMIPPSIMMVIFALLTEVSLGRLLIAGVMPGLFLTVVTIGVLEVIGRLKPKLLPKVEEHVSWKSRMASLGEVWPIAFTFLVIMAGIYCGIFTPTVGGAIGAFVVLLLCFFRSVAPRRILNATKNTGLMNAQVLIVVLGGLMFAKVVVLSGVVENLVHAMSGMNPVIVIGFIVAIFLVLGALLDPVSMFVIGVPFTYPVMCSLGFDPIQIGIITILLGQAAEVTPPIGFNCYVVASAANVDAMEVFRGVVPFLIIMLVELAILFAWPPLSLWLPSKMF